MGSVGTYEAKTHLSRLLERVAGGERITITRNGKSVAVLIPPESATHNTEFAKAVAQWRKSRRGVRLNGLKVRDLINTGRR